MESSRPAEGEDRSDPREGKGISSLLVDVHVSGNDVIAVVVVVVVVVVGVSWVPTRGAFLWVRRDNP